MTADTLFPLVIALLRRLVVAKWDHSRSRERLDAAPFGVQPTLGTARGMTTQVRELDSATLYHCFIDWLNIWEQQDVSLFAGVI